LESRANKADRFELAGLTWPFAYESSMLKGLPTI
jgi:hypothetical protein